MLSDAAARAEAQEAARASLFANLPYITSLSQFNQQTDEEYTDAMMDLLEWLYIQDNFSDEELLAICNTAAVPLDGVYSESYAGIVSKQVPGRSSALSHADDPNG